MGTGSFPRAMQPGRGVDHPHPSIAEIKERVELYLWSPLLAFVASSRVNLTFTIVHLWMLATSWERVVCTDVGRLSVSHPL
jgi:hypothetical protein